MDFVTANDEDDASSFTRCPPGFSFVAQFFYHAESIFQDCSQSSFNMALVSLIHQSLSLLGVPEQEFPTPTAVGRAVVVIIFTLIGYYLLFGQYHIRKRKKLTQDLEVAQAKVRYLQERLLKLQPGESSYENGIHIIASKNKKNKNKKEIRIFMDGAFDLLHYGHMNAFRLARSLGTHLVVGVNSAESITKCKGAPLMNDRERIVMVQGCKFVDQVIPDCPYIMSHEYLAWVFEKYDIDYVVHGDDPCIVDGKDVYATAKETGRYRSIPRTEGVSTTDILGRMLLMTKEHHYTSDDNKSISHADGTNSDSSNSGSIDGAKETTRTSSNQKTRCPPTIELLGKQSKFLTTSLLLKLFSADVKAPKKSDRVIYIDGAWDLFHPGHVLMLQAARERGDYLIVGIYGDSLVNQIHGMNLPLMNLHERVLSVLGCEYVDDVLIDAPYQITKEMIASLKISEVVSGMISDRLSSYEMGGDEEDNNIHNHTSNSDRYKYPKEAGIFNIIPSQSDFDLRNILRRIQRNQETFQAKFERKMETETVFFTEKHSATNNNDMRKNIDVDVGG